jgi:hypothetical protein
MKISEHAMKKFNCLFGFDHEKREKRFAETFLYPNLRLSWQNRSGLYREDILIFGKRCDDLDVRVIGLETIFDSDYPLHTQIFEDYMDEYNIQWLEKAVKYFEMKGVEEHIVPYFHISRVTLDKYLLDEGG